MTITTDEIGKGASRGVRAFLGVVIAIVVVAVLYVAFPVAMLLVFLAFSGLGLDTSILEPLVAPLDALYDHSPAYKRYADFQVAPLRSLIY